MPLSVLRNSVPPASPPPTTMLSSFAVPLNTNESVPPGLKKLTSASLARGEAPVKFIGVMVKGPEPVALF